jgi:hypothetical protein
MSGFKKPHVSFDGFCETPLFQMVPHLASRRLQFYSGPDECEIYIEHPEIAGISNFENLAGGRLSNGSSGYIVDSFPVLKNQAINFTVNGRKSGSTFLHYEAKGKPLDLRRSIEICVKKPVTRTVSFFTVQDSGGAADANKGSMNGSQISEMFENKIRSTFLQQCNVELKQAGNPKPLTVTKRLANPLNLTGKSREAMDQVFDLVSATDASDRQSDILVFCMWDIIDKSAAGVDMLACNIDGLYKPGQQFIFFDDSQDAFTLAHEFGHALGLEHNVRSGSLMNAYKQVGMQSSRLEQFEINTANPDGVTT